MRVTFESLKKEFVKELSFYIKDESELFEIAEKCSIIAIENGVVIQESGELKRRKEALNKRKEKFYKQLLGYVQVYPKEMIRAFYDYWTESNRSYTKMLFELKPTWNLSGRLATWARNSNVTKNTHVNIKHPYSKNFMKVYWTKWKNYMFDEYKFAYRSYESEQASMDMLSELSDNDEFIAREIINQSIASCSKSFFPLRKKNVVTKTQDEIAKEIARKREDEFRKVTGFGE